MNDDDNNIQIYESRSYCCAPSSYVEHTINEKFLTKKIKERLSKGVIILSNFTYDDDGDDDDDRNKFREFFAGLYKYSTCQKEIDQKYFEFIQDVSYTFSNIIC